MPTLARIERHPIKSHGRERLSETCLTPGEALPWDRRWALAHEAAKLPAGEMKWVPCQNFSLGSRSPALTAIDASLDEAAGSVTLSHPQLPTSTFYPDDPADQASLIDWVRPLVPANRAMPSRVVSLPGRGLTDTDYASVSLLNLASNADLSAHMHCALSPRRWRANLWLEGLAPWAEENWPGRRFRIGEAEIEIIERIVRCLATAANPETGIRDADTLGALEAYRGDKTMGVYARVMVGGRIAEGDRLEDM